MLTAKILTVATDVRADVATFLITPELVVVSILHL